jgi:NitT/TauT family transport system substrate-binding protein
MTTFASMTSARARTALAAIIASALWSFSPLTAAAADNVTLLFDWIPSGSLAPFYYGAAQGCFSENGFNVTFKRGFGGVDTVTKIAAGAAEFGYADLGTIMLARARTDAPVKAFVPIQYESAAAVAVLASSPIRDLHDLEGHSLAAAPGDSAIVLLPAAAAKGGLDLGKVNRETVDPSVVAGLLLEGKVDAITTYVMTGVVIANVAKSTGKDLRLLEFGRTLGIYGNALLTSEKILAANPTAGERFRKATECSYKKTKGHVEEAVTAMAQQVAGMEIAPQVGVANAGLSFVFGTDAFKRHPYGWDMDRVRHTWDVVSKAQGISVAFDPASTVLP